MTDVIQLLPDAIANQIAAGEVIQRPASVVKELMENSIDAGAEHIHLIIKEAGKTLIQVVDDGSGMSESDARLSLERHATSKLKSAKDLETVNTMGFRGEALASIAAISHLEMKTRTENSEIGTCIKVKGSDVESQEFCQAPVGTSISVKHLFYNVPARRKFLKSNNVELRHIIQEFQHIALAYPEVEFTLHHNDEELYRLTSGNYKQRIINILGKKYKDSLVPIKEKTELIELHGFVGKPDVAQKTRRNQYFFVNNRYVKDYYLNHAILQAFESLLPEDHNPIYAVYIDIDPEFIDVNVHPTKQEIKFEDQRIVYHYLKTTIRHALGKYHISPSLDFDSDAGILGGDLQIHGKKGSQSGQSGDFRRKEPKKDQDWQSYYENIKNAEPGSSQNEQEGIITVASALGEEQAGSISHPFQLKNSYIVTQIKTGLIIIDQYYAHFRILYERFLESTQNQNLQQVEQMMFPQTLELQADQSAILNGMLDTLNTMGFDIREFGQNTFIIQTCPVNTGKYRDVKEIVRDLLTDAAEEKDLKTGIEESVAELLAANSAIQKGKQLTDEEMKSIIDQLFACEMPYKTPSGKKCFVTFTTEDIATLFNHKL